jgi:arsenite oxidase small subunit
VPNFPVILVANLSDLQVGTPVSFNYPLQETPNILVKLGIKAQGGVGPDGDIVAFSQICQHLGCIWAFVGTGSAPTCNSSYTAAGPVGYCCCHGSIYDLANAAKVVGGPTPRPEPMVILYFDSATGNIYATGMTAPSIFGYDTGSNNVSADLQGGTLVS